MKVMRYFQLMAVSVLACLAMTGCTHNDGDIGEWFGEWHLQSIEIDGVADADYDGDVLWKFQNNIVDMVIVEKNGHSREERFGTWTAGDSTLTLDFSHSDDLNAPGTGKYAPPAQTLLPSGVTGLKILKLTSQEIMLQYEPASGEKIVYTLRKRG